MEVTTPTGRSLRLQHRTLLDVHLDVGGDVVPVVAGVGHRVRIESELAHRLAKMNPVVVDGVERRRVEIARNRPTAEQRRLEPDSFLVAECNDVDGIVEPFPPRVQGPKAGDGQHHPERAVVPPGVSHRVEMGAEDEPARAGPAPGEVADHVAHRVDPRAHARLAHPPHDDLGRLRVLRGQITARELGRVLAALRELVEPLHDDGSEIHAVSRHPTRSAVQFVVSGSLSCCAFRSESRPRD